VYLYSALYVIPQSQGAQAWITVLPAQCYLFSLVYFIIIIIIYFKSGSMRHGP